jgi:hypothetical protein
MASSINASTSGAGGVITTADNTGILNIQTAGTTAVTIDTSQNVGIGTASPAAKLNVATGSGTLTQNIVTIKGGGSSGSFSGLSVQSNSGDEIFNVNNLSYNVTMGTVAGNLLVGKTDTTLSTGGLIIEKYTAAGETAGKISVTNRIGTGQYILQGINASGGIVGGVVTTSTATSFNTSSDYRLKENIVPMTGALDKVAQLKPVTYTWKANGSNAQGFIAHELQEVVPDCVTGEKDAVDENGNIKPQGIDTSFLVATLTAAIQEQQAIINDLKARVTALEAK